MADSAPHGSPGQRQATGRLLIAGEWTTGEASAPVLDKYRLQPFAEVCLPGREQVRRCIARADAAFRASTLDNHARGAVLDRAAALIEQRSEELVDILRQEAGFPRSDAAGEVRRCAATFRLSAEEARDFGGEIVPIEGAGGQTGRIGFTLRVPLGVVCAITPFNAPLNTVAHKVGPALAAGNAVVLKPSMHTPLSSCLMAEVLIAAGLPPGLISVLHGGAEVAQWLLDEPVVRFYAFTGSTEVGRAIQERVGLRRTQMELGSIAHCILCADANLHVALPKVVNASFRKAGQVCTSIQVLLVERSRLDEVETRLAALVTALPYGDPGRPDTVVGPVISEESARRIESWIGQALEGGARRLAGGERVGAVVPPTLLGDVDPGTPIGCREVFGPVLCIAPFDTLDEAIARVNATPFGLATGLFTNRLDAALTAARRLEVGGVHINETPSSRVDVMPYGGTKDSGFGREGPRYAVREMSEERMITLFP
ncbi:aldehyde dehydrogenase family protein [Methylobacterium nodulans]|uniref:Aldehyde Dehydrogenase n=1 Tax=Methylobacterium nodulans (strain LMG 21967 / CNCM I-2342 / ORS 2060) TaxID=460265 RepID=B8IW66_METNO|nr:aldehyde dehydrogenase family protein [Methylobacterium nodulans]ACL62656.1 Aldehyde Dehydrogenase [Methylobacterium nodulans ORS 2060]